VEKRVFKDVGLGGGGQFNARVILPVAVHSTGEMDRYAVAVRTGSDLQYRQGISDVSCVFDRCDVCLREQIL
jgi:hypothetical protein